ncbi:MAG: class I SAM-dependent methyltransferase [Firmicutes bacterium]|nr:class I SAM-dependent methyltransferase [Bacillota bacterium]
MKFYQMFCAYYDNIFPFAGAKKSFFEKLLVDSTPAVALDLGAATGELTNWLASRGIMTTGVDLSEHLLNQARERQLPNANFVLDDLLHYTENTNQRYDLIVCIGNTLPHLRPAERKAWLDLLPSRLTPHGTLVIQTVNYTRILKEKPPGLAEIKREDPELTFTRLYDYNHDGSITFTARLRTQEAGDSSAVTLWPFTAQELINELPESLVPQIQYASFNQTPYEPDQSPAWILVATCSGDDS